MKRNPYKLFTVSLITFFLWQCVPVSNISDSSTNSQNKIVYKDKRYYDYIKTVRLDTYPAVKIKNIPTALSLNSETEFLLSFDDLTEDVQGYMVKIIHCNANWSPSSLHSIDYLFEYNEFRITDYFVSLDTKTPYIHYKFRLPKVRIPGNYLLVVYEEEHPENPVITQRFCVFENIISFKEDPKSSMSDIRGHRINFSVDYTGLGITDPITELKATIIQNGRWDNAKTLLPPTFIRTSTNQADFRDFNTMNFDAGNEFRFFDIRSVISPGPNVLGIERESDSFTARIVDEKPRTGLAYTFIRDLNGSYEPVNYDSKNSSHHSEYVNVQFNLISEKLPHDIYIFGELTNWSLLPGAKMGYDTNSGSYRGSIMLKQGWYDYQYYYNSPDEDFNFIEGNHINTENFYEVLIYKVIQGKRDQPIVGYYQFGLNERLP